MISLQAAIDVVEKSHLGTYKYLLAIFASCDIYLSILQEVSNAAAIISGTTFGIGLDNGIENDYLTCFYLTSFVMPFSLMMVHFLYRYWSVSNPHLIALFSNKKFIALLSAATAAFHSVWYVLDLSLTGPEVEVGAQIIREEYKRRNGKVLQNGWLVMNYWEDGVLNMRVFLVMIVYDSMIILTFIIATTLGTLTFYYIRQAKKAEKMSAATHNLQRKLFIALCAQTFIPLVFVYIPHTCIINFPLLDLPLYLVDDAWTRMTACFPAWDAIIILMLIRDYRDGLLGIFRKASPTEKDTTWNTMPSMVTSQTASSAVHDMTSIA